MLEILQKLLETHKNSKVESVKIPLILCLLGILTTYISDKIPPDVTEKGIVQVIGLVITAIGATLLFFNTVSDIFNISIISGISDGIISGLISVFIVSSIIFAPIDNHNEDNLYMYRIAITLSYGMIYGAISGLFFSLFDKNSKIDIVKHFTLIFSILIFTVYFLSQYLINRMPTVPSDPMTAGQIFLIHAFFTVIFIIMYIKRIKMKNTKMPAAIFFTTSIVILVLLLTIKQRLFYPSHYGLDDENLWIMTFYVGDIPSAYAFSSVMVAFTLYVATNVIYAMRTLPTKQESQSGQLVEELPKNP